MFTNSNFAKAILAVLLIEPKTRAEVANEVGRAVSAPYVAALQKAGLVKPKARVQTGRRGRPAHVLMLTDKGRKRAKRLASA